MDHRTNLEKLFSVSQFRKIHEEMNHPDLFFCEMGSGKISEQINSLINYSATHMLLKKKKKNLVTSTLYIMPLIF